MLELLKPRRKNNLKGKENKKVIPAPWFHFQFANKDDFIATAQLLGKTERAKTLLSGAKARVVCSNIYLEDTGRN